MLDSSGERPETLSFVLEHYTVKSGGKDAEFPATRLRVNLDSIEPRFRIRLTPFREQ